MEAPSKATATSSTCFALNAMPARQRESGCHAVRIAIPSTIAMTNPSYKDG